MWKCDAPALRASEPRAASTANLPSPNLASLEFLIHGFEKGKTSAGMPLKTLLATYTSGGPLKPWEINVSSDRTWVKYGVTLPLLLSLQDVTISFQQLLKRASELVEGQCWILDSDGMCMDMLRSTSRLDFLQQTWESYCRRLILAEQHLYGQYHEYEAASMVVFSEDEKSETMEPVDVAKTDPEISVPACDTLSPSPPIFSFPTLYKWCGTWCLLSTLFCILQLLLSPVYPLDHRFTALVCLRRPFKPPDLFSRHIPKPSFPFTWF
ncbi:hypothetical protein C8J56DRAFT_398114 [Mycena floridula]|nr:hypothetical protein C8J56DRAFT_398114 [Mycena floridula]